jgi:hypothetical protein
MTVYDRQTFPHSASGSIFAVRGIVGAIAPFQFRCGRLRQHKEIENELAAALEVRREAHRLFGKYKTTGQAVLCP